VEGTESVWWCRGGRDERFEMVVHGAERGLIKGL